MTMSHRAVVLHSTQLAQVPDCPSTSEYANSLSCASRRVHRRKQSSVTAPHLTRETLYTKEYAKSLPAAIDCKPLVAPSVAHTHTQHAFPSNLPILTLARTYRRPSSVDSGICDVIPLRGASGDCFRKPKTRTTLFASYLRRARVRRTAFCYTQNNNNNIHTRKEVGGAGGRTQSTSIAARWLVPAVGHWARRC